MWKRARWVAAAIFAALSFFGSSPYHALRWLFTARGRLGLLLVALGILFWPGIKEGARDWWLRASRSRLASETNALVDDLVTFAQSHERLGSADETAKRFDLATRLESVEDVEEKNAIWNEHTTAVLQRHEKQTAELRGLVGGRLAFLLGEYQRRGLVSDDEKMWMEFWALSPSGVLDAVEKLRGLAKRVQPVPPWRR